LIYDYTPIEEDFVIRQSRKKRLGSVVAIAIWLLAPSASIAKAEDSQRTLILFDRSASMVQLQEGVRKIDIAKQLFRDLAKQLENDPQIAIRFFAGGTTSDKAMDCQASEIGLDFGSVRTSSSLASFVDNVKALGHDTPITYALEQARSDLAGWDGPRKIILVSDGQETCDRDPEALAELFFDEGISVDTIGIGPPDAFSQLGMIALSGGGEFQLAENLEGLQGALDNVLPGGAAFGDLPGGAVVAAPSETAAAATAAPPTIAPLPTVGAIDLPEPDDAPRGTTLAVEIIFDASGSMAGRLGGRTKLTLAKEALSAAALGLNSDTMLVAFRAYGFDQSLEKTPEASCPNTELLLPFTNEQRAAKVTTQADALAAYGYTPIAKSLELAGQDLLSVKAARHMIILISDGEETCGGDPQAVARALREQGIDLETHVVGFDLDETARSQMQAIAREGAGAYYDAADGAELGESLVRVINVAKEAADPWDARLIHPVTGSDTMEDAAPIGAGTYTLDEHLQKGEERFFEVETLIAQRGLLRAVVQSRKAIFDEEGAARESEIAYSGFEIRLYRPDGSEIKGHWARVYGERGEQAHTGYVDLSGDGFYFSIGNRYDTVNKDALFQLDVDEAGDLAPRQDAPDERANALPADMSSPLVGHLGLEDREDIYAFAGLSDSGGLRIDVQFTDSAFRFQLDVRDRETGRRIERFTNLTGTADITVQLPPATEAITLGLKDNNPSLDAEFSSYTISLTRQ
jgi:Ca-activated chloride channel family protein